MLIGFTGKAGSGKSTACQMVNGDLPDVKLINFKDGLVQEMKQNFPTVLDILCKTMSELNSLKTLQLGQVINQGEPWSHARLFTEKPPLMRALMQEYGTEVRRADNPDYWVDTWKKSVLDNQQFHIVCDDVRFLNEARAIKELGGVLVRIKRDDITDTGTHQSEAEMDQIEVDHEFSAVKEGHDELHKQIRELYTAELVPGK